MTMALPKKADCTDCLKYREVKWAMTAHGMEAVCAECIVNRKLILVKSGHKLKLVKR